MRNIVKAGLLCPAFLMLAGCGTLSQYGVTCSVSGAHLTCGIDFPQAQDLPAPSEARDEKPDESLAQPLLRFEEDAP